MQNVIITGADGFVGSYVTKHFLDEGVRVLAIGRKSKPTRLEEHPLLTYLCADLTEFVEWTHKIENKYDTFIHLAWSGVSGDDRKDYNIQTENAILAVECMRYAKTLGCSRFINTGSIGEKELISLYSIEPNRAESLNNYFIGKLMAHYLLLSMAKEVDIELVCPIITNIYGEGEFTPRFINSTLRKIIKGEPLNFSAATQNYDFIHAKDAARAIYLIAKNGKAFNEYLVGSGNARPLKEYIYEIINTFDYKGEVYFSNVAGISLPLSEYDMSKTMSECGFVPEISFKDGVLRTYAWIKKNS